MAYSFRGMRPERNARRPARTASFIASAIATGSCAPAIAVFIRIASAPNIYVRYGCEVVAARGEGHLETLTLADRISGVMEEVPASWLFIFIGASPRTEWLGPQVARIARITADLERDEVVLLVVGGVAVDVTGVGSELFEVGKAFNHGSR